jgi:hypothetical protein
MTTVQTGTVEEIIAAHEFALPCELPISLGPYYIGGCGGTNPAEWILHMVQCCGEMESQGPLLHTLQRPCAPAGLLLVPFLPPHLLATVYRVPLDRAPGEAGMNPGMKSETAKPCIRHGDDRAIARRHQPDCRDDDCRGCQPCPERHCSVCRKAHLDFEPVTCIGCLGRTRSDLAAISDRLALGEQLLQDWWAPVSPGTPTDGGRSNETPLPGGDLLVMVGPGSWAWGNRTRDLDEQPDDPEAIAYELTKWEDDWRRTRGQRAAAYDRELSKAREYLDRNMGWAAQNHPAFPEFAKILRGWRTRLAGAVRDSDQPIRGVHCQDCPDVVLTRTLQEARPCKHVLPPFIPLGDLIELADGTYRRTTPADGRSHYQKHQNAVDAYRKEHEHCDQGGFENEWACPRCHRSYTRAEYGLAVRTQYDQRRAEMDAKKTRLEAATTAYVTTSRALLAITGQAVTSRALDLDRYLELTEAHDAARLEYAEALVASGYAVPVGLIPDEAA